MIGPGTDILVVGATIAGLTAATVAARRGCQVVVLDHRPRHVATAAGHGVACVLAGLDGPAALDPGAAMEAIEWVAEVPDAGATRAFVAERGGDESDEAEVSRRARRLLDAGARVEWAESRPFGADVLRPGPVLADQVVVDPIGYARALRSAAEAAGARIVHEVTVVRVGRRSGSHITHFRSQLASDTRLRFLRSARTIDTLGVTPWGRLAGGGPAQATPVALLRGVASSEVVVWRDGPASMVRPLGDATLALGRPGPEADLPAACAELGRWTRERFGDVVDRWTAMRFDPLGEGPSAGESPIAGAFWARGHGFWELTAGTAAGLRLAGALLDGPGPGRLPAPTRLIGWARRMLSGAAR